MSFRAVGALGKDKADELIPLFDQLISDGGTAATYEELEALLGDPHRFSFNSYLPVPDTGDDRWRIENWGCQGDASDVRVDHFPTYDTYEFTTSSKPPERWLLTSSKPYPELQFELVFAQSDANHAGLLEVFRDAVVRSETGERFGYDFLVDIGHGDLWGHSDPATTLLPW